jgi:hypothetical protein
MILANYLKKILAKKIAWQHKNEKCHNYKIE